MVTNRGEVSQLLERIQDGDRSAEGRLFDLLYADLRRMAAHQLRRERSDHTLQPTALVHEVYVKVFPQNPPETRTRAHFMALVAQVMRRFLVDHARNRKAGKRGGPQEAFPSIKCFVYDTATRTNSWQCTRRSSASGDGLRGRARSWKCATLATCPKRRSPST